jgi:hypothetical protein
MKQLFMSYWPRLTVISVHELYGRISESRYDRQEMLSGGCQHDWRNNLNLY